MNPLLFGPVLDIIKQVLGGLGLSPAFKERAQQQAFDLLSGGTFDEKAAQAIALAQADTNKADAQSGKWWQAGWRPFIGWTCGMALFSQYIIKPWVQWICIVAGHPLPDLPGIDDQLWQLMGGMLGLGGLRTIEKLKSKA